MKGEYSVNLKFQESVENKRGIPMECGIFEIRASLSGTEHRRLGEWGNRLPKEEWQLGIPVGHERAHITLQTSIEMLRLKSGVE